MKYDTNTQDLATLGIDSLAQLHVPLKPGQVLVRLCSSSSRNHQLGHTLDYAAQDTWPHANDTVLSVTYNIETCPYNGNNFCCEVYVYFVDDQRVLMLYSPTFQVPGNTFVMYLCTDK